jgi:hypothetical protein
MTTMAVRHFFDDEERFHCHDPNAQVTHFGCAEGHTWTHVERVRCWCGWPPAHTRAPLTAPPLVPTLSPTTEEQGEEGAP